MCGRPSTASRAGATARRLPFPLSLSLTSAVTRPTAAASPARASRTRSRGGAGAGGGGRGGGGAAIRPRWCGRPPAPSRTPPPPAHPSPPPRQPHLTRRHAGRRRVPPGGGRDRASGRNGRRARGVEPRGEHKHVHSGGRGKDKGLWWWRGRQRPRETARGRRAARPAVAAPPSASRPRIRRHRPCREPALADCRARRELQRPRGGAAAVPRLLTSPPTPTPGPRPARVPRQAAAPAPHAAAGSPRRAGHHAGRRRDRDVQRVPRAARRLARAVQGGATLPPAGGVAGVGRGPRWSGGARGPATGTRVPPLCSSRSSPFSDRSTSTTSAPSPRS